MQIQLKVLKANVKFNYDMRFGLFLFFFFSKAENRFVILRYIKN
jgi:hypothetical protein